MTKKMKTTVITYEQFHEEDFKAPSKYFIVNCLGDYIFISCRDKQKAIDYVKEEYEGKYSIRTYSTSTSSGNTTVKCSVSNKSRAGAYTLQIKNNQGRGI